MCAGSNLTVHQGGRRVSVVFPFEPERFLLDKHFGGAPSSRLIPARTSIL